jgi:WD40 repeat protein
MVRKIPKPYASSYLLNAVGFSPDGRYLATGSDWDTQLRVIDLDSPDQKLKYWMLHGHTSGISRIAHGPKGPIGQEWLLSAGFSGSVLEWEESALRNNESSAHSEGEANSDIKRDEFKYRIGAPELRPSQPVTEVDVSMHGRFILTGGSKGQIELWDGTKHVLISDKFEGHTSDIRGAAFWGTGKDQLLFTADKDKILIWPGPDNWADILCKKLLWNMSDKQWRDWVSPDIPYKKQCPNLPKLASE